MTDTKLVITGNPGVGKHTCARYVIQKIGSGSIVDINKLAITHNAVLDKGSKHGLEVNTKKLTKLLASRLKESRNPIIIVGHLAPYVLDPKAIDIVTVLRRSPYELIKTFEERNYSFTKIRENVASEIIGVSFYDSIQKFGKEKVAEIDTTAKQPEDIAMQIVLLLKRKSAKRIGTVDWISLVHKKGDLSKFLEY
ncbi:MAG TPA: AAA family ATPase [Nitrososphaeraceae archaeon]|nr:AAA family ATPase [Nitrososphaeraceae archaeon]